MAKKIIEVMCLKLGMLVSIGARVDGGGRLRYVPSCDAWDHRTASHCLDEEEEWHDG